MVLPIIFWNPMHVHHQQAILVAPSMGIYAKTSHLKLHGGHVRVYPMNFNVSCILFYLSKYLGFLIQFLLF